jgi:hypothetical protein
MLGAGIGGNLTKRFAGEGYQPAWLATATR